MARIVTSSPIGEQSLHLGYTGSLLPIERYSASSELSLFNGLLKLPSLGP